MVDARPALTAILRRVEGVAPGEGGGVLPGDGAQHVLIRHLAHFPSRGAQPATVQYGFTGGGSRFPWKVGEANLAKISQNV